MGNGIEPHDGFNFVSLDAALLALSALAACCLQNPFISPSGTRFWTNYQVMDFLTNHSFVESKSAPFKSPGNEIPYR